ncbi:tail assembly protein [Salmonella enterica]|nr:tail assembly protein [Salmonella enterica]ELC6907412.1 tail assembly protein [Salmonella enterica]
MCAERTLAVQAALMQQPEKSVALLAWMLCLNVFGSGAYIPGLNVVAATVLFSSGTSMALGGVAQMLAPQAKSPAMHSADNGRQNTYFSSLENMAAQGNPVPLAYGEVMTGSRRISQEITSRDESSPDKVVVFGRRIRRGYGCIRYCGLPGHYALTYK